MRIVTALTLLFACTAAASDPEADAARDDARALAGIVDRHYAYRERLPGGHFVLTPELAAEAEQVRDRRSLVRFAERALMLLADHHAITGASLPDSRAVFPSYGDLWVDRCGAAYCIEQVRADSPAARAGIAAGDRLIAIEGEAAETAVASFWRDLGTVGGGVRDGHGARVLAAGRRDQPRTLTVQRAGAAPRTLTLPTLYAGTAPQRPAVSSRDDGRQLVIRFNDSLGRDDTVAAFDRVLAGSPARRAIVLDLTDTPSGGNTGVARGIMGWFVTRPTGYQIHSLPVEERDTGIARRWIEQVSPRAGKHHAGRVTVRVGRWTGSMGEGLTIGLHAMGARVEGDRMAGLLGAIYDHRLPRSGVAVKLPTERLYAVDGTPREAFVPARGRRSPRSDRQHLSGG